MMLKYQPEKLFKEKKASSKPGIKVIQVVTFLNPPKRALGVEDQLKRVKVASLGYQLNPRIVNALATGRNIDLVDWHHERARFLKEASQVLGLSVDAKHMFL